ncbi:MAG: hypothetical protein U0103_28205 [Candidatus Obscuribacterales bacterium]|nr:hypothetical protein [Cyanobacteria bacterium SZAS LIN-5]
MSLKTKSDEWKERVFKMIVFFAILGAIVLGVGGWFLSKTLSDALAPNFGTETTTTTTATPASTPGSPAH